MDDDGVIRDVPLTITARLWTTDDGELHVDLDGSSAQSPGGINVPWASSHAAVYFGVRALLRLGGAAERRPDAPRAPALRRRAACCGRGSRPPCRPATSPCSGSPTWSWRRSATCCGERAVAAAHVSFPTFVIQATDPRNGRVTIMTDILGGGGGARPRRAGRRGDRLLHVELRAAAGRDRRARVPVADRAHRAGRGLGRCRRAAGRRRDAARLHAARRRRATASTTSSRPTRRSPPAAATAAGPARPARSCCGAPAATTFEQLPGKGEVRMRRGDTLRLLGAGGGGFGACLSHSAAAPPRARSLDAARTSGSCRSTSRHLAEHDRLRRLEARPGARGRRRSARPRSRLRPAAARRTRTAPRPTARRAARRPPPRPPPGCR